MKIIILISCLLLTALTGLSMVPWPPANHTNALAEINWLNQSADRYQSHYYGNGRIARLEQEVNRLETGFAITSVLIGSTFASLFVLAVRDRISERKSTQRSASGNKSNGLGLKANGFDQPGTQTREIQGLANPLPATPVTSPRSCGQKG